MGNNFCILWGVILLNKIGHCTVSLYAQCQSVWIPRLSRSHIFPATAQAAAAAAEENARAFRARIRALHARFLNIDFYQFALDPTLFSFAYVSLNITLNDHVKKSQQRLALACKMDIVCVNVINVGWAESTKIYAKPGTEHKTNIVHWNCKKASFH